MKKAQSAFFCLLVTVIIRLMNDDLGIEFQKAVPTADEGTPTGANPATADSGNDPASDVPAKLARYEDIGQDAPAGVQVFDFTKNLDISPAKDDTGTFVGKDFVKASNQSPAVTQKPAPQEQEPRQPEPIAPTERQPSPVFPPVPPPIPTIPPSITPVHPPAPPIPPPIPPRPPTNPPVPRSFPPVPPLRPSVPPPISITPQSQPSPILTPIPPPQPKATPSNGAGIDQLKPGARPIPEPGTTIEPSRPAASRHLDIPVDPNIKPLRTYEGDVAEVLSHKTTSATSIAIAENKNRSGEERISNKPTKPEKRPEPVPEAKSRGGGRGTLKWFIITVSIVLIGGGIVSAYYLYSVSPIYPQTPAVTPETVGKPLVPADSEAVIAIDGLNGPSIAAKIRSLEAKPMAPGSIQNVVLTKKSGGSNVKIGGPDMLKAAGITPPDILTRSLAQPWMLGIYTDESGLPSVFVVADSDFFQNSFAGMLQWEPAMADDLKIFLYPAQVSGISNIPPGGSPVVSVREGGAAIGTTSSATSSVESAVPEVEPYFTLRGAFRDRIIMNRDVREFVTDDGHLLFLYAFVDNSHLVMTNSEAALSEIVSRLEKQSLLR